MITTMEQVHEMSIAGMISEGHDIASRLDAIYRETSLPGSQDGLGSSAMLHHECRHMAAQLEAIFKKSSQLGDQVDRQGTATLDQVDEDTFKLEQDPAEDASRWCTGYVTRDAGQPDVEVHPVGSVRVTDNTYNNGPWPYLGKVKKCQRSILTVQGQTARLPARPPHLSTNRVKISFCTFILSNIIK